MSKFLDMQLWPHFITKVQQLEFGHELEVLWKSCNLTLSLFHLMAGSSNGSILNFVKVAGGIRHGVQFHRSSSSLIVSSDAIEGEKMIWTTIDFTTHSNYLH